MTTVSNTPNYFRIVYQTVSAKGVIRRQQLLVDALNEKDALAIATNRLTNDYNWHKIQGCYKA